ncbi:MAG: hypothetical protein KDB52_08805 [Solirubrobacterales bacterium]|nr:hypothetical protein [Solirubrobacterales bacterium]
MESPAGSRRLGWLAPLTVGLLLVATVAAFGWSQRLKREPLVIDRVEYIALGLTPNGESPTVFSPNGDCKRDRMSINFRTTKSDTADVEIIGLGGKTVRTLARDRFFKRYREHTLVWNGLKDDGKIAFTSKYRVRVTMHGEGRVLYLPGWIRLHKYAPRGPSGCTDPLKWEYSVKEPGKPARPMTRAEVKELTQ